jgi:hypothetical protein
MAWKEATMKMKTIWTVLAGAAIGVTLIVVSCGGGGGGEGAQTRFEGSVANATAFLVPSPPQSRWAWLSPVGVAWAQATGVQVCLDPQDPSTCVPTDENGSFVLLVSGDLVNPCLTFIAAEFTGRVCIEGTIPQGSVVRVGEIECSVSLGTCQADDVEIESPDDTPSPSATPGEDDSVSEPDDDVSGVSEPDDDVPSSSDSSEDEGDDNSGSSSNSGPSSSEDEPGDD